MLSSRFSGRHHTEESKQKIKDALKGKPKTEETKKRMVKALTGRPVSAKTRNKMKIANLGKNLGDTNPNWAGDGVCYKQSHRWARSQIPLPLSCPICGKILEVCPTCGRQESIDLCNIDHKYRRDLSDWFYACRRCHKQHDAKLRRSGQLRIA